jgi:CelD/BcsL family acetyltransferase involved in cellulose biosynthesis
MSRIEWIEEPARFEELRPGWEQLAEADRLPFSRHGWFAAWWRAFGRGRRLQVCALWEGAELAGVFPLLADDGRLEALTNVHTPAFRPLVRAEDALPELVQAAVDRAPGIFDVSQLPSHDRSADLIAEACRDAGRPTLVENGRVSPVVETTGELSDYLQAMDRKWRKDVERRRRKLEAEHEATVSPVAVPVDVEVDLAAGFAVEASGWKGQRGTAVAQSRSVKTFYRAVADEFAKDGRLRLSTISAGGRLVAFDYCLLDHGRLWILKGGYDETFRPYAPGLVLTLAQIERAFELGLEAVELCGDVAPWKLRFANGSRAHCSVFSYGRRPGPLARYAYRRTLRPHVRSAYHRLFPGRRRG